MIISKDLIAASATPLILSILSHGDSYGYAIIQQVHELSDGEMEWADGMLYPILHRLRKMNWWSRIGAKLRMAVSANIIACARQGSMNSTSSAEVGTTYTRCYKN
ncbi:MAG: PadR family transcriptional regulator [Caldilineaceae bacterium]